MPAISRCLLWATLMLLSLIVLAALAIDPAAHDDMPDVSPKEIALATLNDLSFGLAVEEYIISAAPRDTTPPEPYKSLIAKLGDPCYRCREIASRKLQRASKVDQRWLFWGLRDRDPEIQVRCNAIIRRLTVCPSCKGTGISTAYAEYPCWDCDGRRTLWAWSIWD